MRNYLDEQFKKYIEHKRVCFVGACPNLKGRGLGHIIDSYDIVVRSNNFWRPFMPGLEKDYGTRCDIVYINRQFCKVVVPFPIAEMKIRGISWLCFKGLDKKTLIKYNNILNARDYRDVIRHVSKKLLSATAGLYLCIDLLNQNPDELYYTGIDFFVSRKPMFEYDNYQEYLPGYLPEKARKQGNIINMGKKVDAHDFFGNARYFFDLFMHNKNFKTDDFILDLLYGIIEGRIKQGEIKW